MRPRGSDSPEHFQAVGGHVNFSGLCAFPLTPLSGEKIDWDSFGRIMQRLVEAKVDSIGVLGSTGCYPYFSPEERRDILKAAVEQAGLAESGCLPLPLRSVTGEARDVLRKILEQTGLVA